MIDVRCPPDATCNPPPPVQIACPQPVMDMPRQGVRIEEQKPDSCVVVYPMPDCPPGVMCNPPRPQAIDCPER
jgi:hypothetical protein